MFESWLKHEISVIRERYGKARLMSIAFIVLLVPFTLLELILLLDGGGLLELGTVIFLLLAMLFVLSLGNYKKRFVKPLLASVQQELPTEAERQEFACQMQSGQPVRIPYAPSPQAKACELAAAEDYCYLRQPKKSRIFKNKAVRRIVLTQESYTVGTRGHIRWCWVLTAFPAGDDEQPVWKGCFTTENALYQALDSFKAVLPPEVDIQDDVAYGKTEAGKKEARKNFWMQMAVMVLFIAAMYILVRVL